MLLVKKLPPEKYSRLREIFDDEFESDLPEPHNSDIFVAYDGGKMVGFVLSERVQMLGQLYVVPEKRNNTIEITKELLSSLREKYDGKEVVGAVASEPRFKKLYESLGMQKIFGDFYRKNIS
jgi:hypothetical protein